MNDSKKFNNFAFFFIEQRLFTYNVSFDDAYVLIHAPYVDHTRILRFEIARIIIE